MNKFRKTLLMAGEDRLGVITSAEERAWDFVKQSKGEKMRKKWFTWLIVITAVVGVFYAFNYQGSRDAVPLSEIFPDENGFPAGIEYEFVEDEATSPSVEETAAAVIVEDEATQQVSAAKEVAVESTETAEMVTAAAAPVVNTDFNYTIQIASFKSQKQAEEALAKVRTKVPSAYIGSIDLGAKGIWYRIYAGQFQLRSEAEVSLSDIQQSYDSSFIISPKKSK